MFCSIQGAAKRRAKRNWSRDGGRRRVCKGLQKLSQETKFTKEELQFIYRGFKQECPTGMMTEEEFRDIYTKFFPMGGT